MNVSSHKLNPILTAFLALSIVVFFSSCGSDDSSSDGGSGVSATWTSLHSVFSSTCGGCHDGASDSEAADVGVTINLSGTAAAMYTIVTGYTVKSENQPLCEGLDLVVASSSATSYLAGMLVESVNDSAEDFGSADGCIPTGSHISRGYLSAAEQTALTEWIDAGAENN